MTPNMILDTLSKIGYYPKIEISQDITPIHVRTQTKLNNFQEVKIEPRIEEPQVEAITEAYNNFSTSLKMSFANIKDTVPQDFIIRQEDIN